MSSRAARVTVVLLLVAVGAGAGVFLWDVNRRLERVEDGRANVDAALEGMIGAAAEIARLQHEYVASGRPDESVLSRAAALFDRARSDARALPAATRSSDGNIRIKAVEDGFAALAEVDGRIRDHVAFERLSAAADLATGAALDAADDLNDRLAQLRSAERAAARTERQLLQRRQQQVLAGAGGIWLVGLLLLARRPPPASAVSARAEPAPAVPARAQPAPAVPARAHPAPATPSAVPLPSVDLAGAAAVCSAIAQVTSTGPLPALLAQAAEVLDAPGIVIWMGGAEELFAVTGHGYDPRVLGRLGPIRRQADNATAAAWRTGEPRIVAADTMSNGAIVAPMIGPGGCIGVLAAEVRRGREIDAAVQATTSIFAAQLATLLAAWPQASAEPASPSAAASETRLHA